MAEQIQVRDLALSDYDLNLFELLAQLTTAEKVSRDAFEKRFHEMYGDGDRGGKLDYQTVVAHDEQSNRLVGAATLLIQRKFIRSCGQAAHIEDVVVDNSMRGRGVGKRLIRTLVDRARRADCYKVILDCADHNLGFYESCGFKKKENQMALYF